MLDAGIEKIDYLEICNASNLSADTAQNYAEKKVALTAAFIGGVRLIDNLLLH